MKRIPRISESEWQVMRVLWAESPRTANEVVDALNHAKWKPKTIKTLLNRLVRKKALGFDKKGRAYNYYPLVDEVECMKAENHSLLSRVYGGALKPMLANLLEDAELTSDEIEDLKRILDERGR